MNQPKTILVVDDDRDIRECLKDLLEAEGYLVILAKDGQEALQWLEKSADPHLILLDLMMPVMNALEFIDFQRKIPRIAHIPSVLMSASSSVEQKAVKMNAQGHIKKPFDVETLLKTVEHYCGGAS